MTKKLSILGKLIFLACLVTFLLIGFSGCVSKTNPYVESLNIDMLLNEDGSADIVHTRTINFDSRDSEWWNYYLKINLYDNNAGNYGNKTSELKNLSIKVDNINYPIDENLSTKDLDNFSYTQKVFYKEKGYAHYAGNQVELGVVMPLFERGVHTVSFSYTLTNLMIEYSDCVGLYYKFIDETETNFVGDFTAKVNFSKVSSLYGVAIWTHIDNGSAGNNLDTDNLNNVTYVGENINAGTYLETRLLLKNTNYVSDKKNDASFNDILEEENQWKADFEKEVRKSKAVKAIDIVLAILAITASIAIVFVIKKKIKPKLLDNAPEYYREIPKGWTAGEMAPLYHYYAPKFDISDSMSATILELCRRGYIKIDIGEKKKEATISIVNTQTEKLRGHEAIMLGILVKTSRDFNGSFTMKQMEKYASKNYSSFAKDVENYKNASKLKTEAMKCYPNKIDKGNIIKNFTSVYYGITMLIAVFAIFIYMTDIGQIFLKFSLLGFLIGSLILYFRTSKFKLPLTEVGQENYDIFKALGKFMQEFSNISTHELPQLVLWEEFMVYATAMGIADKVAEQIEIAYPEYKAMIDNAYSNNRYNNTFLILYLMSPRIRMSSNFAISSTLRGINSTVMNMSRQATIAAAAKKFGGGSGGGFGGGGGFRGGGGGFGGGGGGAR